METLDYIKRFNTFFKKSWSPSIHEDAALRSTTHPNTAADKVQPLMAMTLLNGSAPPAGQCSCITAKTVQERPEEHDEDLKVSTCALNSPDLNPAERPLDVP